MMRKGSSGLTLIELVVTVAILSILASLVMPLTQMTARRVKEIELRRNLRIVRTAIDDFKKTYDKAVDEKKILASADKSGYPETLQQLVDGYDFGGLSKLQRKSSSEKFRQTRLIHPNPGKSLSGLSDHTKTTQTARSGVERTCMTFIH
jgi:prepilin-type N-terminal cleavage/methylation domain-containing protein